MTRNEILSLIEGLAHSTGIYGRLLMDINNMEEDDREELLAYWDSIGFEDELEFIRFFEEGIYPAHYERPDATDKDIKQAVAATICDMLHNNIVEDNGVETLRGWTEDGKVFSLMGMKENEVKRAMLLVDALEPAIEVINQTLGEL